MSFRKPSETLRPKGVLISFAEDCFPESKDLLFGGSDVVGCPTESKEERVVADRVPDEVFNEAD